MFGLGAIGQFAIGEQSLTAATAEFIGPDKYMRALSEPVRLPVGTKAPQQAFLFFNPAPVVSFSWFGALTEPVRTKPINPAAYRQDFFMQMAPSPFVATGWFNWLSEPKRFRQGLSPHQHPFFFYAPNQTTITPFAWFALLSEPKRFPKGLRADLQREFTNNADWIPSPIELVEGWFTWLSEPKRFPKGLSYNLQSDYTAPPRMLPSPTVTVIIQAKEIDSDQALFAINVVQFNPAVSARVSLIEIGNGLSPTAVIEH